MCMVPSLRQGIGSAQLPFLKVEPMTMTSFDPRSHRPRFSSVRHLYYAAAVLLRPTSLKLYHSAWKAPPSAH